MPIFTKFSVWENEVRKLIDDLHKETRISTKDLTEWFYGEGILVFQKAQGIAHNNLMKVYLNADPKNIPDITTENITNNKIAGFNALKAAFYTSFIKTKHPHAHHIESSQKIFADFQETAIHTHQDFYELQAQITTTLNSYAKDLSPIAKQVAIISDFNEAAKTTHAQLKSQIADHVILTQEFSRYMEKQMEAQKAQVTETAALHTIGTFAPASKPTETSTPAPTATTLKL